jgi:hypothetical protein
MEVRIDGKLTDITLEKEKTLGDFLSGISEWLENSGHFPSALKIDGAPIGADAMGGVFDRPLDEIQTLDIETSVFAELLAEALINAGRDIVDYGNASFEEQGKIRGSWETGPTAGFLAQHTPDMYARALKTLKGEGLTCSQFLLLVEERIRELKDPGAELASLETLVESTAVRLEDLPLDIQTGKDSRAAETIQLFSNIAEKIFRLSSLLKLEGIIADIETIDTTTYQSFIEEFSAALQELIAAYEVKDAVLVGDLAEYELAPRLRTFYAALRAPAAVVS